MAYDDRSDIESSVLIARNAEGEAQSRQFGDGIARPATAPETQLLEAVENRMPAPEAP